MADHSELVAEMLILEQMGTQERQKLAKKRRLQQIKKWTQREKEWMAKEKQMNKRLASKISEENNGLNLKHYTQFSISEKSPTIRSSVYHQEQSATDSCKANNNGNNNNYSNINSNHNYNGSNIKYKQNNVSKTTGLPSSINNNILRKCPNSNGNGNSRSVSLNGLDAEDLCSRPINSKVHFDSGVMLLEAAARNDLNEVKRLLMLGVSPDSTNHDGLTTLHQGCIEASEPMINLLLEFGANVDARDTEQWTPLHAACTCGHLNLVRILVERGADLLAINGDGNMPFDLCEDEKTLDYLESQMVAKGITQEMIDLARVSTEMQMIGEIQRQINNGVEVKSIMYPNGVTPAHVAAANGYLSALKFLIKHGADMTAVDNDLWSPLHGVACWGNESHLKIIELLIESGASLDSKTINDETVFDLCDNEQILEKLNEIKDEIESKQAASDADKLRRTQSRTNSRIHSIRRTSVRDKSQISRRDAREEALLRSESSGSLPTNMMIDGNLTKTNDSNDMHPLKTEYSHDDKLKQQATNDANTNFNPASQTDDDRPSHVILHNGTMLEHNSQFGKYNDNTKLAIESTNTLDQQQQQLATSGGGSNNHSISGKYHRNDSGIETSYMSTDLDAQTNIKNYINDNQIQPQLLNSIINGSQSGTYPPSDHSNNFDSDSRQLSDDTTRNTTGKQSKAAYDQPDHLMQTPVQNTKMSTLNQHNGVNQGLGNSFAEKGLSRGPSSMNVEIVDASKQPMTVASGSKVIVQFNSTNYTLSNLKKQRSDMRMRTTSIGGLNNDANLTGTQQNHQFSTDIKNTIELSTNDQDTHTHNEGGSKSSQKWSSAYGLVSKNTKKSTNNYNSKKLNGNNQQASTFSEDQDDDRLNLQSPNTSLRRFRGEPSELIGGDERNVKHGCCSVI